MKLLHFLAPLLLSSSTTLGAATGSPSSAAETLPSTTLDLPERVGPIHNDAFTPGRREAGTLCPAADSAEAASWHNEYLRAEDYSCDLRCADAGFDCATYDSCVCRPGACGGRPCTNPRRFSGLGPDEENDVDIAKENLRPAGAQGPLSIAAPLPKLELRSSMPVDEAEEVQKPRARSARFRT